VIRRLLLSATAALLFGGPCIAEDIVDAAAANGNLTMLMQSLRTAGLIETLRGDGPFTIFAPDDNNAFIEIEDSAFEEFLIDRPNLNAILTYHVVPGRVMTSDLTDGTMATTLQGGKLLITRDADGRIVILGPYQGGPRANGATIVSADIEASNGVIHVIDTILRPPPS